MIDVVVLKVRHSGEEYKKLLPHIHQSDVFSEESPGLSEDRAMKGEENWKGILRSGMTRTKFLEHERGLLDADPNMPELQRTYRLGTLDYLYRSKVPLWSVERFSQEDSHKVIGLHYAMRKSITRAMRNLNVGNIDSYLAGCDEFQKLDREISGLRDSHIARNLERAESAIRDFYKITGDPLRFKVCLGATHKPEKHTSLPVSVVDLTDGPKTIADRFYRRSLDDTPQEVMYRERLLFGADQLLRGVGLQADEKDLEALDPQTLIKVISKAAARNFK